MEEPFRAQAIISNPVAYGHIHCAEALRCPLLVAFPQPWTPTKEFPHVFSGLPFTEAETQSNPRANYTSYAIIDELQWQGLDAPTWRRDTLGLSGPRFPALALRRQAVVVARQFDRRERRPQPVP